MIGFAKLVLKSNLGSSESCQEYLGVKQIHQLSIHYTWKIIWTESISIVTYGRAGTSCWMFWQISQEASSSPYQLLPTLNVNVIILRLLFGRWKSSDDSSLQNLILGALRIQQDWSSSSTPAWHFMSYFFKKNNKDGKKIFTGWHLKNCIMSKLVDVLWSGRNTYILNI